ncbi:MAG: hypothetical protein U1F25_19675 [Rubrivivax sp.]
MDFDRRDASVRAAAAPWGGEAAAADSEDPLHWLPMAPANACGLGASSCFKCHNGKRAAAPMLTPQGALARAARQGQQLPAPAATRATRA